MFEESFGDRPRLYHCDILKALQKPPRTMHHRLLALVFCPAYFQFNCDIRYDTAAMAAKNWTAPRHRLRLQNSDRRLRRALVGFDGFDTPSAGSAPACDKLEIRQSRIPAQVQHRKSKISFDWKPGCHHWIPTRAVRFRRRPRHRWFLPSQNSEERQR